MNVSGWLAPEMYECTECGYIGSLFLEIDPEDYKLEKSEDKKKNEEKNKSKED
jgi:hypothetical protein